MKNSLLEQPIDVVSKNVQQGRKVSSGPFSSENHRPLKSKLMVGLDEDNLSPPLTSERMGLKDGEL